MKCEMAKLAFSHCTIQHELKGVLSFTIFLEMFSEDIAGLSSLGGVVQRNVPVDVLQQDVNPGLPDAGQKKAEKTHTHELSFSRGHSS